MERWGSIMHTATAFLLLALFGQISGTDRPQDPIRLFIPDGQLTSHDLRVFVTADISADNDPQLVLLGAATAQPMGRVGLARNQEWGYQMGGQRATARGTLILFDLQHLRGSVPFYRARVRVTPMLQWTVPGGDSPTDTVTAIAADPVNIGNGWGAALWTVVVVVLVLAATGLAARGITGKKAIDFLRAGNGLLSLSRAQVVAWTVAIGTTVLGFGLVRLTVPEIPETLIVLMGLSLGTGGVSYALGAETKGTRGKRFDWSWGDLIRGPDRNGDPTVSMARAQMLFWTVITLVIFVVKSLGEGQLWPVPWQLVALMGLSQAGYLSTKTTFWRKDGGGQEVLRQQADEVQRRRDAASTEHPETEPTP
jgi:hypothetical protein